MILCWAQHKYQNSGVKRVTLLLTALLALASSGGTVGDLKAVKTMPRDDAARHPAFRGCGVVTAVYDWMPFAGIVAPLDDPGFPGVYFDGGQDATNRTDLLAGADRLSVGDVVEIDARVETGIFAPSIFVRHLRVTGRTELPRPALVSLGDLAWGVRDNQRVRIRGVVGRVMTSARGEGTQTFVVHCAEGGFMADVNRASPDGAGLVDAEVEIEGIAASFFNQRGEFTSVHLEVEDASRVKVLVPPPEDPFSLPATGPNEVLEFSMDPPDSHRRKVAGVVTYAAPGDCFFLESGGHAIKVEASGDTPAVGDSVEVVAFPAMEDCVSVMRNALWRRSERAAAAPVAPVSVSAEDVFEMHSIRHGREPEDYSARLVTIGGRVVRCVSSGGRTTLVLDDGGRTFTALADWALPEALAEEMAYGPLVRVTGVCVVDFGFREVARVLVVRSLSVLMRGEGDLRILPDAEYARRRRAATVSTVTRWAALALVAGLLAALFVMDRRRRRLAALTEERRRMAGDLHDTIEQYFAGANILLQTGLALTPDKASPAADAMEKAGDLLMHAKGEIRNVVWNLRASEKESGRLADVLRDLARRVTARGVAKVRTFLVALPDEMPRRDVSEYVLMVQEAVTNAMKHGHAKTILVTADAMPGGGFSLSIANDGEAFDFDAAEGPETGHFGVSGMRQRAAKVGGVLSFSRRDGWVVVKIEKKGRGVG